MQDSFIPVALLTKPSFFPHLKCNHPLLMNKMIKGTSAFFLPNPCGIELNIQFLNQGQILHLFSLPFRVLNHPCFLKSALHLHGFQTLIQNRFSSNIHDILIIKQILNISVICSLIILNPSLKTSYNAEYCAQHGEYWREQGRQGSCLGPPKCILMGIQTR